MDYLAGVNTGTYSRPSYAYSKPKLLQHSSISAFDTRIGFTDIQKGDWPSRLRAVLKSEFGSRILPSKFGTALRPWRENYYLVLYCGYVCKKCLTIGVVADESLADEINRGGHNCDAGGTYSSIHLTDNERNRIANSLRNRDLPELLVAFLTTISNTEKFKLVTWKPDSQSLFTTPMRIEDLVLFTRTIFSDPVVDIDLAELTEILKIAGRTFGTVGSERIVRLQEVNACIAVAIS